MLLCIAVSPLLIVSVVIDGYTHNSTLTSGDSVPLGAQVVLVCHVVGLPYGTPLNYTWGCQNGQCVVVKHFSRKIYSEYILVVNTTYSSFSGTYTCQVTASAGQQASWRSNFTLVDAGVL